MEKTAYYILYHAYPKSNPPFNLEIGFGKDDNDYIVCEDIPQSVDDFLSYCKRKSIKISDSFTTLYPIYLEIMNSDYESAMHSIAWLVKDVADKNNWKFDRIGGYTGNTVETFLP